MAINEKGSHCCGYVGFFAGKRVEVYADTLYQAKMKIADYLKVKPHRQHMITVMLAESDGNPVIHSGADISELGGV